jgi:hypothetical protein
MRSGRWGRTVWLLPLLPLLVLGALGLALARDDVLGRSGRCSASEGAEVYDVDADRSLVRWRGRWVLVRWSTRRAFLVSNHARHVGRRVLWPRDSYAGVPFGDRVKLEGGFRQTFGAAGAVLEAPDAAGTVSTVRVTCGAPVALAHDTDA